MNTLARNIFVIILSALSLFLFLKLFWPFLIPSLLAIILVIVFYPWFERLDTIVHRKTISALILCLLIIALLILPISILVILLGQEAFNLFLWAKGHLSSSALEQLFATNALVNSFTLWIQSTFGIPVDINTIRSVLGAIGENLGSFIYNHIRSLTSNIISLIANFFFLFIILFYFFRDGANIFEKITSLIPLKEEHKRHLIKRMKQVGKAVFWGNLITALLQGIAGGMAFFIFNVGNPVLLGFGLMIASFIPVIGLPLVYGPIIISLILLEHPFAAIGIALYGIVVSNLILDNIVKPKLIEKNIQIHPLLIFLSIIGGVEVFGVLGVLYGPMIVTFFFVCLDFYEEIFNPHSTQ